MSEETDLTSSVRAVRALFGGAACSVALVDEDGATLTYVAADGEGAGEIVGVDLPVGRGIAGWAVMSGQPVAVRDVQSDARFERTVAEATNYVPNAILAAPMFDGRGEVLGVVSLLDPTVDAGADWSLAVLGTLASTIALVVVAGKRATGSPDEERLAALGRRVLAVVDDHRR